MTKPFDPFNQCTEYYYRIEKLLADNTALKAENESLRKDMLAAAQEEIERLKNEEADWKSAALSQLNTTNDVRGQLTKAEQLWQVAQGRCDGLEDQLAKAEQRVAEACAELAYSRDYEVEGRGYYDQGGDARQTCYDIYDAIKKGEWRKFVKEM